MTIHINTANMPLSLPPCKSRSANTGSDALNIFLEWVMLVCQHSQHVGGRSQSLLVQGKPRVRFILYVKCSVAIVVSVNAYVNKHFIALSFQIRFVINKRLYALCHRKKYACFISVYIYMRLVYNVREYSGDCKGYRLLFEPQLRDTIKY